MTIGIRFAVCMRPNLEEAVAPRRTLALGALVALVTATVVALVVYGLMGQFGDFSTRLRMGTACWIGCALSGSARQIVDWARERHGARGATTDGIEAAIGGGEIVALAGAAPLSVLIFSEAVTPRDLAWRAALPLILGLSLGLVTLWLLHSETRIAETWGILLGVQLLSTGLCLRAGTSVIAAGFVLGWLLGRDHRAGGELRRLTHPAEGAVLLPLLVVAGASLHLKGVGQLGWLVIAAVSARILAKLALAWVARSWVVTGQPLQTFGLGLSLASSGEIACLVTLEYALSVPGQLGQLALACAIAASLFGEFYGAAALRRVLSSANELGTDDLGNERRRSSRPPDITGWI